MPKLFFSLSSDILFITILKGNKCLAEIEKDNARKHSDNFLAHLQGLLTKTNLSLKEIEEVYFLDWTGSQTGIRISLAFVLTLQILNSQVKIYHLNSLLFQVGKNKGISLLSIGVKKAKYHCAVYQNSQCLYQPQIILKEQLEEIKAKFLDFPLYEDFQGINYLVNFTQLIQEFQLFNNQKISL